MGESVTTGRCRHCGGTLIGGDGDDLRCLLCARPVQAPETPRQHEQRVIREIRAEHLDWFAPLVGARRHVRKGRL